MISHRTQGINAINAYMKIENIISSCGFSVSFAQGELRSYRGKPTNLCKANLLDALFDSPIFVWFDEGPEIDRCGSGIDEIAEGLWRCEGIKSEYLLEWLYLGGWSICNAPKPKRALEDYVKLRFEVERDSNFISELLQQGATLYIDSFFDNIEWDVWKLKRQ